MLITRKLLQTTTYIVFLAQLSSLAWFSCCLGIVTHGGLGKHLYDTTYKEVYWFFRVCPLSGLRNELCCLEKHADSRAVAWVC